jgi:hypothetical protein
MTLFQALYGILHGLWGSWQLKDLVCLENLQESIWTLPQAQLDTLLFTPVTLEQHHIWFARLDFLRLKKNTLLVTYYIPDEQDLDMPEASIDLPSPAKVRLLSQNEQLSSTATTTRWLLRVSEDYSATGPYEGDLIHIDGVEYPYQGWPKKVSSWSLL